MALHVYHENLLGHGGPQSVGTMEAELASLQQLNAGLQRDLARFQEREDLLKQARGLMFATRPLPCSWSLRQGDHCLLRSIRLASAL